MTQPATNGWVRLHPLSPVASGGRLVVIFGLIAVQNLRGPIQALVAEGLITARVLTAVTALGITAFGLAYVAWRAMAYRVTADLVETRRGVVFRSHRHLPLDRIEAVDTAQPLIPRLLGLAEVRIEAVSQGGSELRLSYLGKADAEVVRAELSGLARERRAARLPGRTSAGAATAEDTGPQDNPFHVVPLSELWLGYVAIPAIYLGPVGVIAVAAAFATGELFPLVSILAPAVVAFGVPSFGRLDRVWNFRISEGGDSFVISRGLLNLSSQRIIAGRVQAVRVEQPMLWRLFARFRLVVDVAGYRGERGEEAAATSSLLPIGDAATVRDLLQRVGVVSDIDALQYVPLPARARWRAPLRWRRYELARAGDCIVARSGLLARRTDIVPVVKLQSRRVTQGPWQRRLRLATVHFDTAGARVRARAPHRDLSEAYGFATAIAPASTSSAIAASS